MGASEGSDGGMAVDCSVGTIVWVRRRNGSWWPGRILGPDELSASHLMSPRSGTPVKLLGREDASVDWYNLEKSKRVKPFRCGEFDSCIERAEASQGIPIKKREKYARREDAILHALQLERQQLEMKQQETRKIFNDSWKRDSHNNSLELFMKHDYPRSHGKSANHKTQSRKIALPLGEKIVDNSFDAHEGKSCKQLSMEEDIPEATRMRGLQDFGLKTAPSKRKLSQVCRKSFANNVEILSSSGPIMEREGHVGGSKNIFSIKKKRSHGGMIEDPQVKRRDRRRPLVHVLQSSVKLPDSHPFQSDDDVGLEAMLGEADLGEDMCQIKRHRCSYLPSDSSGSWDHLGYPLEQKPISETQFEVDSLGQESTSPGLIESSDSDSSATDYLEPESEEDANPASDSTKTLVPGDLHRQVSSGPSGNQVLTEVGNMKNIEVHLPSYISHLNPEGTTDAFNDMGASKWHIKGKRNIRYTGKRPMDGMDGNGHFANLSISGGSVTLTPYESKGKHSKMGLESSSLRTLHRGLYRNREEFTSVYDEIDLLDSELGHNQFSEYGNGRHPSALKTVKDQARSPSDLNDSDNDSHLISPLSWETDAMYHVPRRAYWDELDDEHFEPVYADNLDVGLEPLLIDINLKVRAGSYQGEHVPLVSLMSKLNGKAIVGHPVQIEILEDGSTSLLFRGDLSLDDGTTPPSFWRTARRTAMQRIPRTNPATTTLEVVALKYLQYPAVESKPPSNIAYPGHFSHQAKSAKKCNSQNRSSSGKFQRKPSKKVNLSSQKTRTLSSFVTEHKLSGRHGDPKHLQSGDILSGLIKPEDAMPLVTCVPLKVVFSRIMEAVGRPSSSMLHRARMTSSAVKNQSET